MKNYEKYCKELGVLLAEGKDLAVNVFSLKPVDCSETLCLNCLFSAVNSGFRCTKDIKRDWIFQEESEEAIKKWSSVTEDTPIYAKLDNHHWRKRYFHAFKDGKIEIFPSGRTSFSCLRDLQGAIILNSLDPCNVMLKEEFENAVKTFGEEKFPISN